jgi:hypothetical protein
MVATTIINTRLEEIYARRPELLSQLAQEPHVPDSVPGSVAWLELISRPGGLGGPNPNRPQDVRGYEAELSLILLEVLISQQERIASLEGRVSELEGKK